MITEPIEVIVSFNEMTFQNGEVIIQVSGAIIQGGGVII